MEPQDTFWEKLGGMRTWTDSDGREYWVDSDGKITGMAPLMGDVPFGSGSVFRGPGLLKELPSIDATRKVHGVLPRSIDLVNFSKDELKILLQELKISVQQRIKTTSKLGRDVGHGERQ
ncbi:hypothetical protein ACM46_16920 [Chryseobacterium angstadtii]|uniref:Uncharacterized protein n=1 Tax=Chryseobacterium angstadtii TaxID=558151 RepID=A0A0J7I295_9FLAO|nr:hypothetical protein [Chryseobacterium angstadtii]KMQ59941.1 hypothetical protein ACM46_16920 [Chryseobacterium angstadtii]